MATRKLEPIHPGEILEEEFMRPLALSANSLANGAETGQVVRRRDSNAGASAPEIVPAVGACP